MGSERRVKLRVEKLVGRGVFEGTFSLSNVNFSRAEVLHSPGYNLQVTLDFHSCLWYNPGGFSIASYLRETGWIFVWSILACPRNPPQLCGNRLLPESVAPGMRKDCINFEGKPVHYQDEAVGRYVHVWQSTLGAYAHVHTSCGTHYCLNVDHMQVTRPKKLAYPHGVCVYCGQTGSTKDHIEPVTWTGVAARRFVVTVPSCSECNSLVGDSFAPTVPARREIARAGIRRKYKRVINRVAYTPEQLEEFEGMLREAVIDGMAERDYVLARLAWPEDAGYDIRALDKSDLEPESLSELLPHL